LKVVVDSKVAADGAGLGNGSWKVEMVEMAEGLLDGGRPKVRDPVSVKVGGG
jgi:hypothetical protein